MVDAMGNTIVDVTFDEMVGAIFDTAVGANG